jgi:HSP20 family protein
MAKRDKAGNGEKVPVKHGGASTASRTSQRASLPTRMRENPLQRLRQEMDALFDRFMPVSPAWAEFEAFPERARDVDVQETDNEISVRAEAPGFEAKDFDVQVSGNMLIIQAEHKEQAEDKEKGFQRWERRFGQFQRSIPLSTAVSADKVDARYHNGVLEVHLRRTETSPPKHIEVKA